MRADVQLEHGFVRVANRLLEAILDNEFTGAQQTILLTLVRLTYGWRRKTVTCSQHELAQYMRMGVTGHFRSALRDLIANGVVLELEKGSGRTKSTWAIQKDFVRWGRYAVAPQRLETLFGPRPESNDDLLRQSDLFNDSPGEGDRIESGRASAEGQPARPHEDAPTAAKSSIGETYDGGKTGKDNGQTTEAPPPERARRVDSVTAVNIAVWCNAAIAARWGEQPSPLTASQAVTLAESVAGVPWEIVRASIVTQCESSKNLSPPKHPNYFRLGILDDLEKANARQDLAAHGPVSIAKAGTAGPASANASELWTRYKQAGLVAPRITADMLRERGEALVAAGHYPDYATFHAEVTLTRPWEFVDARSEGWAVYEIGKRLAIAVKAAS